MQNLKTSLRRLIFCLKHDYLSADNIVFVVALVLCFAWTAHSISAMSRNWELTQTLHKKQRTLALLQLEIETAELENAYYRSDEYQELSARQKQNKQLPGEHLVYLPENSAAAKEKYSTPISETDQSESEPSNLSQWMSFLLGE